MRNSWLRFLGIPISIFAAALIASTIASAATGGLVITQDGNSTATIFRFSDGNKTSDAEVVGFAADELKGYYEKMSGARLRNVCNVKNIENPKLRSVLNKMKNQAKGDFILIVSNSLVEDPEKIPPTALLESVPSIFAQLKDDGFAIRSFPDCLLLASPSPRGVLYAVYHLLESHGVRYFAPRYDFYNGHAEYVPKMKTIVANQADYDTNPTMKYRKKHGDAASQTPCTLKQLVGWMAKQRLNVFAYAANSKNAGLVVWDKVRGDLIPELRKRGMIIEVGGHGYDVFLPPSVYKETHPEWFPDPDEPTYGGGKPDNPANIFRFTNQDALNTFIDNVVLYLQERPEIAIFDAWPPDTARWAKSDVDQFGGIPNSEAYLTRQLQLRLRDALPGVRLSALAYPPAFLPPDPEYMYDADILLEFAPYDRSYGEPINGGHYQKSNYYVNGMQKWLQNGFAGETVIYEYYRKVIWHSLPVVLPNLIAAELAYYHSIGAKGLGIYSNTSDWVTYELTHLITAAFSWNCALDPVAYVQKYVRERFGDHNALLMALYFDLLERTGMELYSELAGKFDDQDTVTQVRAGYQAARGMINTAKANPSNSPAAKLALSRLAINLEYAVNDLGMSYWLLLGDPESSEKARNKGITFMNKYYSVGSMDFTKNFASRYGLDLSEEYFYNLYQSKCPGEERAWDPMERNVPR
jgi:hypothetical protein